MYLQSCYWSYHSLALKYQCKYIEMYWQKIDKWTVAPHVVNITRQSERERHILKQTVWDSALFLFMG